MTENPLKKILQHSANNKHNPKMKKREFANRGLSFENDVDISNNWYNTNNVSLIIKRPTPIKVIEFDNNTKRITNAVYEKESTADYNGIYRGRYIDFECKSTDSKIFRLSNIQAHQMEHLRRVEEHGGISFLLLRVNNFNTVYLIPCSILIEITDFGKKSINFDWAKENGVLVREKYAPRIDYIEALDKLLK